MLPEPPRDGNLIAWARENPGALAAYMEFIRKLETLKVVVVKAGTPVPYTISLSAQDATIQIVV